MSKTVEAIKDKVIVQVMAEDSVTAGGIYVPDSASKHPQAYGKVISVGPDVDKIKEGDVILFAKFGGQDILIDRSVIKVLIDNEIFGILHDVDDKESK